MGVFTKKGMLRHFAMLAAACGVCTAVFAQQSADRTIISIERNKTDNTPTSISLSPAAKWRPDQAQDMFKKYLGADGVNTQMVRLYSTTTPMKVTSERYAEYYKGVKVPYGSFTLMSKDGVVSYICGNYYDLSDAPSAVPAISENDAFTKALAYVNADKYIWQDAGAEARLKSMTHRPDTSFLPKGNLTWIEDYNNGNGDRKLHLAWSYNIYAVKPFSRQEIYVDAVTGKILFANSLIKHTAASGHSRYSGVVPFQTAHVGTSYMLFDSTRGDGVHTLDMNNGTDYTVATEYTSATNTWPVAVADTVALDAHWAGEMVYDYWKNVQGRLSWDNLNGILLQYVHYDVNYDNAYWDGTEMTYGDGSGCGGGGFTPLVSLDVTAHEIGHGVCQATANLVYAGESGGIDEGFSDCWGATIESYANPHEVDAVPKQTWWMGEEIGCGTPLRRLDFPKLYGLPDTYLGTNWYTVTGCTAGSGNDQCGVHTNMGVISKWYYLLTIGGSGINDLGNSYSVTGQAFTVSQNILYQTELILASNATYPVLRSTSIAAATTLYGACSAQVQAVTSAWYAVGVGANYVPCVPQMGFTSTVSHVTENAGTLACPASHTINIGIAPVGPAISGGSPVVNVVVVPGTAVAGVDYSLGTTSLTWAPGDASTKYATMTIYDNGAINDDKNLRLAITLTAAGSNATISPTNDTMQLYIDNDDSIPQAGGLQYATLNAGTLVTSNNTSAFTGSSRRGHEQFLLYASELTAAGVRKNSPISQIAFNVTSKSSTAPFIGYTISMGNTTLVDMTTVFATGLTQVFTGSITTNLGLDSIAFNTGTFSWDGTSNVVVEICYGQNAAAFTANDQMDGIQEGPTVFDNNKSNSGTGTGCSLTYTAANQNTARPVVRFKQTVPPANIATVLSDAKSWDVHAGQEVYFYNPTDTNLIAGLKNINSNLGCVTATVTQAGVGFTPASFAPINRSKKEVTITPTINGTTTTYDATIYLTNTELNSIAAGTLFLVKTDAATDATLSTTNSVELTPTLITGTNYVGFKGTFTGFSRFFLVDGPLCSVPAAVVTAGGPTTFCAGGSVTLNAPTGTFAYTYQWMNGASIISGATSSSYTATTAGNYKVIINQAQTCSDTSATSVAVTVNTVSVAAISGPTGICVGQTLSLSDATAGGTWSSASTATATVSTSGAVTGVANGTAVISYSFTNTCGTAVATYTVNVSTGITVASITGATAVCPGATVTVSDITASGSWTSSNNAIATVSGGVVSGVTGGTATISYNVTNSSGCVSSATEAFTVYPAPSTTVAPAGPIAICTTGSILLSAPVVTGYTYQWQNTAGNISGATSDSYSAIAAGTYDVVITSSNGCIATSAPVVVTVSTGLTIVPSVSISASPGTILCLVTAPVTFTANTVNGGSAPAYQWTVNGSVVGTAVNYTYSPANGDIVKCMLTSTAPCAVPLTAIDSVTMTISALQTPSVSIALNPGATMCSGDTVTATAVPTYGGTSPTYLWTKNGINVATGPQYIYMPVNGDILRVTMTSTYPCVTTTLASSVPVTMSVSASLVNTLIVHASFSVITAGQADTFYAIAPNAGATPVFQWYINGVAVTGANQFKFVTTSLTNGQVVTCSVVSSNTCSTPGTATSGGIIIGVLPVGVAQVANTGNDFKLLPNPNSGTFTISGTISDPNDTRVNIVITDVLGQTVYTSNAQTNNGQLSERIALPASLADGTYLVSVTSGTVHVVFHAVLNK